MARSASKAKKVVTDPEICGGDPTLEGTRIRVSDIVVSFEHRGWSPEEIVREFPALKIQDIHAALTYYYERPEDIREEIRRREDVLARDA